MKIHNNYNPDTHEGFLPIRVLSYNIIDWFENAIPGFLDEMKFEVETNELKSGISYHIQEEVIVESSNIDPQRTFHIYENYNQFLWTLCYSLIVLFDEGIQKPFIENRYDGKFDFSNKHIKESFQLLNEGLGLFKKYDPLQFYILPNPEKYNDDDKNYVEKANGLFVSALLFILTHEYSHHLLGHLDKHSTNDESKKDEIVADEYSFSIISKSFGSEKGFSLKYGIILGLISLIFFDDTMYGGDKHPDPDHRLINILSKMSLDEKDNLWGVASLSILLWIEYYHKNIVLPSMFNSYKELFDYVVQKLGDIKAYS